MLVFVCLGFFFPCFLSAVSQQYTGRQCLPEIAATEAWNWNWRWSKKRQEWGQRGAGWAASFQTQMRAKGLAITLKKQAFCSRDLSKTQVFCMTHCKKSSKLSPFKQVVESLVTGLHCLIREANDMIMEKMNHYRFERWASLFQS